MRISICIPVNHQQLLREAILEWTLLDLLCNRYILNNELHLNSPLNRFCSHLVHTVGTLIHDAAKISTWNSSIYMIFWIMNCGTLNDMRLLNFAARSFYKETKCTHWKIHILSTLNVFLFTHTRTHSSPPLPSPFSNKFHRKWRRSSYGWVDVFLVASQINSQHSKIYSSTAFDWIVNCAWVDPIQ